MLDRFAVGARADQLSSCGGSIDPNILFKIIPELDRLVFDH